MDALLENPAIIWFLAGLILLLAELVLPGLIIFFFGASAWLTALVLLVFDLSFNSQLVVFLVASVVSLALLRRLMLEKWWDRKRPGTELAEEFIGQSCLVTDSIMPGPVGGKVRFRGTTWTAKASVPVAAGETVLIRAKESIVLFVEPIS